MPDRSKAVDRDHICIYINGMEIAFDAAKDATNRIKYGVSLAFGARVLVDPEHLILSSIRPIDGEDRLKAIALVDGKLYTAIHVVRADTMRFISVRRSNDGERRAYDRA